MDASWKLFATLREAAGQAEVQVAVGTDGTVADALEELLEEYPTLETDALDGNELRAHISVVHNGVRIDEPLASDRELADGDELALLPPLSGG